MKNKILHFIIGHIPYFVYEKEQTQYYRCTLCDKYLHTGPYNRLFEDK